MTNMKGIKKKSAGLARSDLDPSAPVQRKRCGTMPCLGQSESDLASSLLVQAAGQVADDAELVKETAAAGIQGQGRELPHQDMIQASFGAHDVSGVKAHVGGAAEKA